MKNTSKNRQMLSFSIEPNLKFEFVKTTKEKSINMSSLLSGFIKNWLVENNAETRPII
jgi:hypothetical protein